MFGNFSNPVAELPLAVITRDLVIQGTLRTRMKRLTDVVNEADCEHLTLFNATFMEVGSRRVVAGSGVAQVQLFDVLFLHTSGPTESSGEMRMPKQPVRTILLSPPYTIEGMLHLPYEEELHQAVDSLQGRFIPVTSAKYYAYGVAESPNFVELLVVNRARAHIAVPAGTQWQKSSPPDVGYREPPQQKPW